MHIQKWDLRQPKQEERDHSVRCDALTFRNTVLQSQKGRPDGSEHDSDGIGAVHSLDGEPEDCEDGARDDCDVRAPETP